MLTKKPAKIGWKYEIGHFVAKIERFDGEINIKHKQIPKKTFRQKMRITTAHNIFKVFFWY